MTGRSDSFCPSPADQLLSAVEDNDLLTIQDVVEKNPELINYVYPHMSNKPIIQIAVSNFANSILVGTVSLLIKLGADLYFSTTTNRHQQTLHYATLGQNPAVLNFVLEHIEKDRVNDTTSTGETALHLLIRDGDVKSRDFESCLDLLLKTNIDVNKADDSNCTPIVIAVRKKYKNVVSKLLSSQKHVDIDNYSHRGKTMRSLIEEWNLYDGEMPVEMPNDQNFNQNSDQDFITLIKTLNESSFLNHPKISSLNVNDLNTEETLLQMACERNLKSIVNLLLEKGADVYKTTKTNERTPLEIASIKGFYGIFQKLLPYYQEIPKDVLSTLLQNSIYKRNVESDHKSCLQLLLSRDIKIPVNAYTNGNTPLHYAVKYSDCETIINLLKREASLGNRNAEGILPVEDIYPKTLEKHLDNCIRTENNPPCDRQSTVVIFDYKTLFPNEFEQQNYVKVDIESNNLIDTGRNKLIPETDVILAISKNSDLRYLLKHPVISNFLFLKWYKMQAFFNMNFLFYLIFVLSLLGYIFFEDTNKFTSAISYVLFTTYIILILRELSEILLAPKTYAKDYENYLELCLILSTGYILFEQNKADLLYKQISAAAILLSAVEMMLLIGQYPLFSTYISVFKTVSWNFFKFMLWSAVLIIAFTLSFFKIFHKPQTDETPKQNNDGEDNDKDTDFFEEPTLTFIKVIVMLTGEFDASSLDLDTPLNKILFLAFVFLITITLFNVLNGLAVSDIQTIKNNAEIISLVERINRIVYVENMLVGNTALSKILNVLARYFCCVNNNSKEHIIPTWLARKVFLFPYSFQNNEVKMWLYYKGKIINETNTNSCKPLKDIYMNSKVVKSTKELILREQNTDKVKLRNNVEEIKRNLEELLRKRCDQCNDSHLNVLSILNVVESIL